MVQLKYAPDRANGDDGGGNDSQGVERWENGSETSNPQ